MKKLFAALLVATSAIPASATILTYTLQDVKFSDGATASGSFEFDTALGYATALSITTTAGAIFGTTYDANAVNYSSVSVFGPLGFTDGPSSADQYYLHMGFTGDLSAGGTYGFNSSAFEFSYVTNVSRYFSSGSVSSAADVPEPAMLGLFGLGAIGLGLSRRRKA